MSKIVKYLKKEASFAGVAASEAAEGLIGVLPYLIGVPAAGGAAVGYLASKMTSPGDSDKKALQERVMDVAVREELALQQRKLEAIKKRLAEKKAQGGKAISRKRDMFV